MFGGKEKTPVFLITGYLGSGKTTLLNELLRQEKRERVAVVVNDLGRVNIDAEILRRDGGAALGTRLVELQNGCICCELRGAFMREIEALAREREVEAIFVEASGASDSEALAMEFLAYEEEKGRAALFYLASIVTVVDAARAYEELAVGRPDVRHETDAPCAARLMVHQIEFCDTIVLNKCDLLRADQTDGVRRVIRRVQPKAELHRSIFGKVNLEKILNGRRFDYQAVMHSASIRQALAMRARGEVYEDTEYGIRAFVFEADGPFHRERFMAFLEAYPKDIARAKGYLRFADAPEKTYLFEQAGHSRTVTEASEPPIAAERDMGQAGDGARLVFIGADYDETAIRDRLTACLYESL